MAGKKSRVMVQAFEDKCTPTTYLCMNATVRKTMAVEIEIDIRRGNEFFAVDIARGAGGRRNKKQKFTNKTYVPPMYDEYGDVGASELTSRQFGQTVYEAASNVDVATAVAKITDIQAENQEKIVRAIELQARDARFNGKIKLVNGDEIDFKKKTSHDIVPADKWNTAAGTPVTDISTACSLCRVDGKIQATRFRLTLAEDALLGLKNNAEFKARADFNGQVKLLDLGMPAEVNTAGAVFHGTMAAGSYVVELWTYPQFYDVPMGFDLPNEGESMPYIPAARGLLEPTNIRYDLWFAGIPVAVPQTDPVLRDMGLSTLPVLVEVDFQPYAFSDDRSTSVEAGVRSAPLFVPVQMDGFCTFTDLV